MRNRRWLSAVPVAALVLLAACQTPTPVAPSAAGSSSARPSEFTVMTTVPITQADPAAITDDASAIVAYNVFQRLMTALPGQQALKPDAASDCQVRSPTVYECTLKEDLQFSNGDELTTSDVKFSVERAYRLASPGSSATQLAALDRVQIVSPLVIRFLLKWPDRNFGFALAGPAASIVDEDVYDKDEVLPPRTPPGGSGPFALTALTDAGALFTRYERYNGANPVSLPVINLVYAADSGAVEQAMEHNHVDVVYRGLSSPAIKRFTAQMGTTQDGRTSTGYAKTTLPNTRVHRLLWNVASPHRLDASLRRALAVSLQGDRTLDSIIPDSVEGHVHSFPLGGSPTVRPPKGKRITLTLSYGSRIPDERDRAQQVRDRIESAAGVSVRLTPDDAGADVLLSDQGAWTYTPFAWLQPYLDAPLPGSADKIDELSLRARGTTDAGVRDVALSEIQQQAAADAVVLPISQDDETIFLGPQVTLLEPAFGPGWQLGLWSMRQG